MNSMTVLTAENITVHFGGLVANENVSLKLEKGKILGLIGPNGAGKTTLFNALTGYAPIVQGSITLLGKDITNLPPYKRTRKGIGRTFQIEHPFAGLTVLENVLIPALMVYQDRQEAEAWALECLERVELEDRAKQPSTDLNLARLRRLELAKAIAVKPRVLFLDEMMAGLNPPALENMIKIVTSLTLDGTAILMVEHIMQAIIILSDKVIALALGKKIAEGTAEKVMNDPEVIKAYLGEEAEIEKKKALTVKESKLVNDNQNTSNIEATQSREENAILKIKEVVLAYGELKVVFNVSLAVGKNELVGLIGGNGSGKSTILRAISGMIKPVSGNIIFDGQKINNLKPHDIADIGIAHVPMGRQLFPDMAVRENLSLGAYLPKARAKRKESFERVYELFPDLYTKRKEMTGTLSGGQQQMVAVGRALMLNPKMLIMDEPSLGLAPKLVKEVMQIIQRVSETNLPILLVEQNVKQVLQVSDWAYVLEDGEVVTQGLSKELMGNPKIKKAYLGL